MDQWDTRMQRLVNAHEGMQKTLALRNQVCSSSVHPNGSPDLVRMRIRAVRGLNALQVIREMKEILQKQSEMSAELIALLTLAESRIEN